MSLPPNVWRTRKFKSKANMDRWIEKYSDRVQFEEIFINNGYAVEWRWLRII